VIFCIALLMMSTMFGVLFGEAGWPEVGGLLWAMHSLWPGFETPVWQYKKTVGRTNCHPSIWLPPVAVTKCGVDIMPTSFDSNWILYLPKFPKDGPSLKRKKRDVLSNWRTFGAQWLHVLGWKWTNPRR
jgi:hypothetical protein